MKVREILLFVVAGFLLQTPCPAEQSYLCITSPDHPSVWYNRAGEKASEELRWRNSKDVLNLDVAYYNIANTSVTWNDQLYMDRFELTFPTVHLDRATNQLYFTDDHQQKIIIGHVDSGMLGTRVILNKNVEVSAHRQNGVINAAIRFAVIPTQSEGGMKLSKK